MSEQTPTAGMSYSGLVIELAGLGRVQLTQVLAARTESQVYFTDHTGVLVKVFDLNCGKLDEVSYGPYMDFSLELANYGDLQALDELRQYIPTYYGGHIDYVRKFAYIAMEYLEGQDLKSWAAEALREGVREEWLTDFRQAVHEALCILKLFHRHGIILTDFKPENVIRLGPRTVKFVDLGAIFTPRYRRERDKYVYSATPDHAEVAIDATNIQLGNPPNEPSDIFSAGVALFEMATGTSRLAMDDQTAVDILNCPGAFRFQDSQIKDIWLSYPHLKNALPLLETQLQERSLLFANLWHVLKGYLGQKVADWDGLTHEQQDQIVLATGTTFILEQLPERLQWLAGAIAGATALRGMRLKTVDDLLALLSDPAPQPVREEILERNGLVQYARDLEFSTAFVDRLNTWEVRIQTASGRWAVGASAAALDLGSTAELTYLREVSQDEEGHRFYQVVDELEADARNGARLNLGHLRDDPHAWCD